MHSSDQPQTRWRRIFEQVAKSLLTRYFKPFEVTLANLMLLVPQCLNKAKQAKRRICQRQETLKAKMIVETVKAFLLKDLPSTSTA